VRAAGVNPNSCANLSTVAAAGRWIKIALFVISVPRGCHDQNRCLSD
jgi:hypothetical protein